MIRGRRFWRLHGRSDHMPGAARSQWVLDSMISRIVLSMAGEISLARRTKFLIVWVGPAATMPSLGWTPTLERAMWAQRKAVFTQAANYGRGRRHFGKEKFFSYQLSAELVLIWKSGLGYGILCLYHAEALFAERSIGATGISIHSRGFRI